MEAYKENITFGGRIKIIIKRVLRPFFLCFYIPFLKYETFVFNQRKKIPATDEKKKNLYFTAASEKNKHLVAKVIQKFGHEDFDYLIVVYDGSAWDEPIFKECKIIRDTGFYHKFVKKHVTPEVTKAYKYIFLWDDDLDIDNFSYKNFLDIFKRNNLQLAQPALTPDSYYSFKWTLQDKRYPVGRYTDYVEVMAPVFMSEDYPRYWEMVKDDYNHWGWGYDSYAKSVCKYKNMGIIDQEPVKHTKPVRGDFQDNRGDYERLKKEFHSYLLAKLVNYGKLK